MDFSSMMNAANKNAKKASREVDRIQGEVDNEKSEARRQLEAEKRARMEILRRKQKNEEELARKRKEREEEERRRNFTIPKRDGGPSSSSVNTAAVRAVLERQRAEKEAKEKKAESDKQKLMVLRMQANGGKATKKMGKQFGLDVIDLQTRFGGNNEHLETLQKRKWKEEEEADVEADRYRSGVCKALAAKQKNESALRANVQGPHRVSTSKSNSLAGLCSRHERTRDTFSPPKNGKKAPERREPVVEKKKIQAAAPIDFKSLMAAADSLSQGKSVNLDHLQAKPAKSHSQQKPTASSNSHQKSSLSASDREKLRERERQKEKLERQREAEKLKLKEKEHRKAIAASTVSATDSKKTSSHSSSSNGTSAPPKKEVRKPFTKAPTPPPLIPAAVPGKKYLPGDVRYKEQQTLIRAIAAAPGSSRPSSSSNVQTSKERAQAVREAERQREKEREKQRALKRARQERETEEHERNKKIQKKGDRSGPSSSSYSSSSIKYSSSSMKNSDKRSYEARRMAELREEQMREKERKKRKMLNKDRNSRGGGGGSFYRGGDDNSDDEEDDEDEGEYGDDDDFSDMDDFIDDTDVNMDGMNRRDFEDTLRMVNRKYDTDKWSRNEKMISERDMHSDFRRIQTEENFSKRAGFMEDLQEASKGRSVRL